MTSRAEEQKKVENELLGDLPWAMMAAIQGGTLIWVLTSNIPAGWFFGLFVLVSYGFFSALTSRIADAIKSTKS